MDLIIDEGKARSEEEEQVYSENSRIFQDLCDEIDDDDAEELAEGAVVVHRRRASMRNTADEPMVLLQEMMPKHKKTLRRHSSFESSLRSSVHKSDHESMKEYLFSMENNCDLGKRSSFIGTLMRFNLSLNLSLGGDSVENDDPISSGLQYSCPVLSYMQDDEEDSVDLCVKNRPGLLEEQQPWECLQGEKFDEPFVVKLASPPPTQDTTKPKKRRHSYQILEDRLEQDSPQEIIKTLSEHGSIQNLDRMSPRRAQPLPKALDAQAWQLMGDSTTTKTAPPDLAHTAHLAGVARGA